MEILALVKPELNDPNLPDEPFALADYLLCNQPDLLQNISIEELCNINRFETLKTLILPKRWKITDLDRIMRMSAKKGRFDVMKYLIEEKFVVLPVDYRVNILQYSRDLDIPRYLSDSYDYLIEIKKENEFIFQYLIESFFNRRGQEILSVFVKQYVNYKLNKLILSKDFQLKYLIKNYPDIFDQVDLKKEILSSAIEERNLELVKFLTQARWHLFVDGTKEIIQNLYKPYFSTDSFKTLEKEKEFQIFAHLICSGVPFDKEFNERIYNGNSNDGICIFTDASDILLNLYKRVLFNQREAVLSISNSDELIALNMALKDNSTLTMLTLQFPENFSCEYKESFVEKINNKVELNKNLSPLSEFSELFNQYGMPLYKINDFYEWLHAFLLSHSPESCSATETNTLYDFGLYLLSKNKNELDDGLKSLLMGIMSPRLNNQAWQPTLIETLLKNPTLWDWPLESFRATYLALQQGNLELNWSICPEKITPEFYSKYINEMAVFFSQLKIGSPDYEEIEKLVGEPRLDLFMLGFKPLCRDFALDCARKALFIKKQTEKLDAYALKIDKQEDTLEAQIVKKIVLLLTADLSYWKNKKQHVPSGIENMRDRCIGRSSQTIEALQILKKIAKIACQQVKIDRQDGFFETKRPPHVHEFYSLMNELNDILGHDQMETRQNALIDFSLRLEAMFIKEILPRILHEENFISHMPSFS